MKRKHNNDYAPIPVGGPEDWYETDKNGTIILDVKKQPAISNEKWLAARKNANGWQPDNMCIGGSAASIIAGIRPGHENGCGLDTFGCKLRLFNEMTGVEPISPKEDEGKEELFRIGHAFEDSVAVVATEELNENFFSKQKQKAYLINDQRMFLCGIQNDDGSLKYPHSIGDMDRILEVHDTNTDKIVSYFGLEIKTAHYGALSEPHWIKSEMNPLGVPEKYEVQCRHYMGVCNLDGFFIACQEHSMKPSELCIRFIPRDIELETHILDNEEAWALQCLNGIAPEPSDDEPEKYMDALGEYTEERQHNENAFEFPEETAESITNWLFAVKKIEELEAAHKKELASYLKLKAESEIELCAYFDKEKKEYGTMVLPDNRRCFVRQTINKARETYDIERLKQSNPELAAKCIKETVVKTNLNKAEKCDLKLYSIPGKSKGTFTTKINVVENKTK